MTGTENSNIRFGRIFGIWLLVAGLGACASPSPIDTVDYVELDRFMGDWYVIANIPTFFEKGAHNAVESYSMNADGTIATRFVFRQDDFNGEPRQYNPRGFVRRQTGNAVWGMQFIWPFKAEYRVIYLKDDYSQTIIGRSKRDYVWIMARTPVIEERQLQAMKSFLAEQGYDISRIEKVPQRW